MRDTSELMTDYVMWAASNRGFSYVECMGAQVYEALDSAVQRVGEWIGGYTDSCCNSYCFSECQINTIEEAVFKLTFAYDQKKVRPDSDNLQEHELTAYRYLENRGMINYAGGHCGY